MTTWAVRCYRRSVVGGGPFDENAALGGEEHAALRRVEEEVLSEHVAHCVEHAINSGNRADQRRKIEELMAVVSRSDR